MSEPAAEDTNTDESAVAETVALWLFAVVLGNVVAAGFIAGFDAAGGSLGTLGSVGVSVASLQVVGMLGSALAYVRLRGRWDLVQFRRPTFGAVWLVVAGLFAAILLNLVRTAVMVALDLTAATPVVDAGTDASDPATALLVLTVLSFLVIAPIEELLFRGVIQGRLREEYGPAKAIGGASAMFALMHLPGLTGSLPGRLLTVAGLFAISLVFGWLYERTETLVIPWVVHGLYNASLFGLLYVLVSSGAL